MHEMVGMSARVLICRPLTAPDLNSSLTKPGVANKKRKASCAKSQRFFCRCPPWAVTETPPTEEQMSQQAALPITWRSLASAEDPQWLAELKQRELTTWETIRFQGNERRHHLSDRATYIQSDVLRWLADLPPNSIHAVVTDPPYGIIEYDEKNHAKLREGRGGVWRIPPSFDGAKRRPLPRFTILSKDEILNLQGFFSSIAYGLLRALAPGGHIFVASNPLVSTMTFHAFIECGFEKRGEIIRLVQTLRGGDRPKNAEAEFQDITVMPRSCWEPWGIFRKPFESTVADNLRRWGTGALRRISDEEPFKDVIPCSPTRSPEKDMAPHPSLKPQRFLRRVVRASLPLGVGIVCDPFAGSGSTLAAAEAIGYRSLGIDSDREYFAMAKTAFPRLSLLQVTDKNERNNSPQPGGPRKV
jgi:DNA modification methylase